MTTTEFIEKIDSEAEKGGEYEKLIAQHLIDCLTRGATLSAGAEKKNLAECLSKIKERARKRAQNGVAAIADAEVYSWAEEYFGITAPAAEEPKSADNLDIDLFDLI